MTNRSYEKSPAAFMLQDLYRAVIIVRFPRSAFGGTWRARQKQRRPERAGRR